MGHLGSHSNYRLERSGGHGGRAHRLFRECGIVGGKERCGGVVEDDGGEDIYIQCVWLEKYVKLQKLKLIFQVKYSGLVLSFTMTFYPHVSIWTAPLALLRVYPGGLSIS